MIVFMGLKFEEFCKCARFCLRKALSGADSCRKCTK